MIQTLDITRDDAPPRELQRPPVSPERHRWNATRCSVAYVMIRQMPGEPAAPVTAHPVRMRGEDCWYHTGQVIMDRQNKGRFAFCALDSPGPFQNTRRYSLATMFRAQADNTLGFEKNVLERGRMYGVFAIESPMTYEAIWFSSRFGVSH